MINLEVSGESATMATVAAKLDTLDGVRRVRLMEATRAGHAVLIAAVRPRRVDALLAELRRLGVPAETSR